ncbi:MAG: hypothetical protein ACK59M_05295, partial [Pseudomonadota bacterium]
MKPTLSGPSRRHLLQGCCGALAVGLFTGLTGGRPGIGSSTALSMQSAGQPEVAQGPCTARFGGPAAGLGAGRVVAVRFRLPFRA